MSWLIPGDKKFHKFDHGHNWLGGDGTPEGDARWRRLMDRHMDRHRRFDREGRQPAIPQGRSRWADLPE